LLARSRPAELFARPFWAGSPTSPEGAGNLYYRPLANLSYWLDLKLAGPNPRHFHTVNIALNLLAAVVVTVLIWELLHSGIWALFGGLLFAAHSAHVESVAFVSGRADLLLSVFLGLAAAALLRGQRKRVRWWWLAVPPLFALALLAKETALLFPALVALTPLLTRTRYDRRYWLLVAATMLVALAYFWLRDRVVTVPPFFALALPTASRLIEVANTFGLYIRLFFWPFDHRVTYPADPTFLALTTNVIPALLFAVSIPLVALRRRFWAALWGYAWVVLFLVPAANVIPLGSQAAERLLYLPSVGLVLVVLILLSRLATHRVRLRQAFAVALSFAIVLSAADTMVRSRIWANEAALFSAMVKEAPGTPGAYSGLAAAVAPADPDSAIRLYDRAIALNQGYVAAHVSVAALYTARSDHRRAIHHLRIANELQPQSGQILNNMGLAFLAASQPESALAAFDRALESPGGNALVHLNRASALGVLGRDSAAEAELHEAIRLDSGLTQAWVALSGLAEQRGRPDSAVAYLAAVLTDPTPAPLHLNHLGTLLAQTGDTAHARACYARALELDSVLVPALYNQAVLLATFGDSAQARTLAERAYRLRPDLQSVKAIYLALTGSR
jgi:Tfp pilus assembly protein PilF